MLLLSISLVSAATIQGTVYDIGFQPVKNAIIEISTVPAQTIITIDGAYLIELPSGDYNLTAKKITNGIITDSTEELVSIESDTGSYQIDLVLFPSLNNDPPGSEGINFGLKDEYFKPQTVLPLIIAILSLIIITVIIGIKKRKSQHEKKELLIKEEPILPTELEKVIQILKNNDKRMHQKHLRKELNLSEAKVSLMIADLESQKKIKKIKKGRGNIIILNG